MYGIGNLVEGFVSVGNSIRGKTYSESDLTILYGYYDIDEYARSLKNLQPKTNQVKNCRNCGASSFKNFICNYCGSNQ
jgi:hypothetical protein